MGWDGRAPATSVPIDPPITTRHERPSVPTTPSIDDSTRLDSTRSIDTPRLESVGSRVGASARHGVVVVVVDASRARRTTVVGLERTRRWRRCRRCREMGRRAKGTTREGDDGETRGRWEVGARRARRDGDGDDDAWAWGGRRARAIGGADARVVVAFARAVVGVDVDGGDEERRGRRREAESRAEGTGAFGRVEGRWGGDVEARDGGTAIGERDAGDGGREDDIGAVGARED